MHTRSEAAPVGPDHADPSPPPPSRLVPRTTLFCLLVLAILLIQFSLVRAGLLFTNHDSAAGAAPADLTGAFLRGLRFDASTACYFLLPFVIFAHLPRLGLERSARVRKYFFVALCAVVLIATFILLAEYEFFREFQTRYNQLAFQYLDQPRTVVGMVWYNYPVGRYVLACVALSLVVLLPVRHLLRRTFRDADPAAGQARRLLPALGILIALFAVAMRGGLQGEPLRWGDAYRSQNDFANQLGLNGLFCLGRSFVDRFQRRSSDMWIHNKMPLAEARAITRAMVVAPGETLLDPADRTVLRRNASPSNSLHLSPGPRPPNVVLVIMESFSARFCGAAGSPQDFTPAFTNLAKDGILFDHAFSGGTHTHQGIFSSMLGFPNLPGHEYLMEQEVGKQSFSSLPAVFKRQGYHTFFLYNGNFDWDNMRGFFQKQGVDTFIGSPDYVNPTRRDAVWGVADQDLFDRANQEFEKADAEGKPFFSLLLTLSNHVPFDLPDPLPFPRTTDMGALNRRMDGVRYADWAVGRFIDQAKKLKYFDNTLFVFVGDHGFHAEPRLTEAHLLFHHVPLLFYSPKLLPDAPRVVHTAAGQSNIPPTILGLLDVPVPQSYWARNLFANGFPDENFVYFKGSGDSGSNRALILIRGDKVLQVSSTGIPTLYSYDLWPGTTTPLTGPASDRIKTTMRAELTAYIKSAMTDLTTYKAGFDPDAPLNRRPFYVNLPAVFLSRNDPLLAHLGLTSLDAVKAYQSPHLVKNHRGHRDILRVETNFAGQPQTLFLKRVWRSAKKDGLKSLLTRARVHSVSRIEWDNYDALRAAGIPTPEPVAFGEDVGRLWERFSFILTAAAPGVPLDDLLRTTTDRRQTLLALAAFVRRLHDAGLFSPDLFTRHIFVSPSAFTVIDMARLDRGSPDSPRLRARDLAALNITAPLSLVTRAERFRFLLAYDPAGALLIPRIRRRVNYLLRRRKYEPFLR